MKRCVPRVSIRYERIAQTKETPFLIIDGEVIKRKFEEFQKAIGNAKIFYALKANPHARIVKLLQQLGTGFEVSSERELSLLLRCGVLPQEIISSNPTKSRAFIIRAYCAGVNLFAFDSYSEIEKLSECAPRSRVYVRLSVDNEGSQWPLSRKFGVEIDEAVELLTEAGKRGLDPYGITFHVGSQCMEQATWVKAIEKSRSVWELAKGRGIKLRMLNIGGGFPIKYTEPIPSIAQVVEVVNAQIRSTFPEGIELFIEPGRSLVGEAGVLVTTAIAKAVRNGQRWLYLDAGVFNGLMETLGGIRYQFATVNDGPVSKWVVAGPSCDSFDVISTEVYLPEPEIGDKVYIMSAGAYTTVYASEFNGLRIPKIYFV
jgi:ornithine decarboxylase